MNLADLKPVIEQAFENRDQINAQTKGEVRDAVNEALNALDSGKARVARHAAERECAGGAGGAKPTQACMRG